MNVKLVAVTSPRIDGLKNAEDIVSYCARVSNPSNQMNTETAPRLLKYLIKHQHWSPFEMASVTVEIVTSRAIAAQILRHRSFAFQEFCITGDSLVTTLNHSGKSPNYIPIKKLYERQSWKNYKDILVRVYDEKNKIFVTSKIKEVFKTGVKPVYEVTLSDGKKIKCTKEHKFFSNECFDSLENIVGLDSKHHCMTKIGHIATNGNLKTIKYVKIDKIKFLGEQETYDLEVEHESHNYVASKILVHNSQRYSTATKLEDIQWRLQGKTNRQVGDAEVDLSPEKKELVDKALQSSLEAYDALIQAGVAKECARMVLPLTTQTTMYMTGTLRSWIHYIELRAKEDTQKEHREIAVGIKNIFMNEFPVISEALGWINTTV
jgi:thymidylate synthase ThyX